MWGKKLVLIEQFTGAKDIGNQGKVNHIFQESLKARHFCNINGMGNKALYCHYSLILIISINIFWVANARGYMLSKFSVTKFPSILAD